MFVLKFLVHKKHQRFQQYHYGTPVAIVKMRNRVGLGTVGLQTYMTNVRMIIILIYYYLFIT